MKLAFPLTLLLATALVSGSSAVEITAFATIVDHYEAIRQELIEDSTEGVAKHADAIAAAAEGLDGDFKASAAGVSSENTAAVGALLPEVVTRARAVAAAPDLASTRDALAELTKPLVRWHELVDDPKPVVAYCSMVKKAWFQPDEAIGNPYAPYMLRCGEFVQR